MKIDNACVFSFSNLRINHPLDDRGEVKKLQKTISRSLKCISQVQEITQVYQPVYTMQTWCVPKKNNNTDLHAQRMELQGDQCNIRCWHNSWKHTLATVYIYFHQPCVLSATPTFNTSPLNKHAGNVFREQFIQNTNSSSRERGKCRDRESRK